MTADIVRIDGGLGSQMIGWMLYIIRSECDPSTKPDVSYFEPIRKFRFRGNQPPQRSWELHRYGIDFSSVSQNGRRASIFQRSYERAARHNRKHYQAIVTRDWKRVFPLVPEAMVYLETTMKLTETSYAAVHIRRGDFLTFSSKVVDLTTVLHLCTSIRLMLPRILVFLSDDPFSFDETQKIRNALPANEVRFLDHADPHVCHGVMRMADLLVTSNSTFSWSAALMRTKSDSFAFSPTTFSYPVHNPCNEIYRAASNWMLHV